MFNQKSDDQNPKQNGKKGPKQGGPKDKKQFFSNILTVVLVLLLIATGYSFYAEQQEDVEQIPLSQLAVDVSEGRVTEIIVEGEDITANYGDGREKESKKETEAALSETLKNYGVTTEQLRGVEIDIQDPSGFGYWFMTLAPFLLPILLIVLFFWLISRQMKGAGMQAFSFGQSKARVIDPSDKNQRVKFKDVAGVKEAKQELTEVVDFLKNPKKFLNIGARIPKGVMLVGPPGSGKTLLARAVAGEAGVPFFIISGSEFVEMFVGVGASRVRDLFRMAKKAAPAIIFVDEIDAVGRVRGVGVGGGTDEREQTLNQILVEMDGFEPNEKVIVMAATNRPDVLDPALLRPGRFDRRIVLDLPDVNDREEILKNHMRKKPKGEDVDLRVIAERTPGFSGADLASLVNEAAIFAARNNRTELAQIDLINAIEKVMLGPERKSHLLTEWEKKITAYHETGHALVASVLAHADPVHKVSIVARGHAGGYTLTLPNEERRLQTRKHFLDEIAKALGGYVAEKMNFDDLTTGPSNDIQVASALARDMVTKYGMSDDLGPIAYESDKGRKMQEAADREYSESTSTEIDQEVTRIMKESLKRTEELLTTHREALDAIAQKLIDVETLERDDFEAMLKEYGIQPKERPESRRPESTIKGGDEETQGQKPKQKKSRKKQKPRKQQSEEHTEDTTESESEEENKTE